MMTCESTIAKRINDLPVANWLNLPMNAIIPAKGLSSFINIQEYDDQHAHYRHMPSSNRNCSRQPKTNMSYSYSAC